MTIPVLACAWNRDWAPLGESWVSAESVADIASHASANQRCLWANPALDANDVVPLRLPTPDGTSS